MDGNVNSFDEQNEQSFLNDKDDEHLELLSLRDLPIIIPTTTTPTISSRSSSTTDPSSDFFFEFLINNNDDLITSTADDVIFHGRLLPYTPPPPRRSLSLSSAAARLTRPQLTESPSESSSSSLPAFRPSRSLNCRKSHRSSHHRHYSKPKPKPKVDMIHINCNSDKAPAAKLPWYWLVFGLPVKIAAEMELKDMKSRQFRRELTTPVEREYSGDRSCSALSWKFLNVLSCKSHASVDVNNTAPLRNSLMF